MYSLRQRFLFQGVTVGAFLTRILRVYLDYLPTSILSFVDEHLEEGRPAYIVNCFGKDAARQTFDVAMVRNASAVRQGCERFQSHVNANAVAVVRQLGRFVLY